MIRREDKRRPSAVARVDLEQAQKCKTSMALSRCSITSRTSSGGKLSSAAGRAIPIGLPKSSSNSSSMQHRQAVGTTGTGCRGGIVSVGLCMFVLGPMRTSNGATLQGDRVLTIPTSVMDVRLKKTHRYRWDSIGLKHAGADPARPPRRASTPSVGLGGVGVSRARATELRPSLAPAHEIDGGKGGRRSQRPLPLP